MAPSEVNGEKAHEIDVRTVPKPERHPLIFGKYDELPVDGSIVLVNDHDPRHLREEFDADHPRSYRWEYLKQAPDDWRVRITKLTTTPLPRVVGDTREAAEGTGAVWKLTTNDRDLDSNVIVLAPGGEIESHTGPDIGVLIHVLDGSGVLTTEASDVDLVPGALVWLPRRASRRFTAGSDGLRYLTVHQRRQGLAVGIKPQEE